MTNDFRLARKNLGAAIATTVAAAGILFLTVGCSTKNYVRSQTAPLIQNTNDLDAKTAQDHRTILDTDQRAQAGITRAQGAAAEHQARGVDRFHGAFGLFSQRFGRFVLEVVSALVHADLLCLCRVGYENWRNILITCVPVKYFR